MPLLISLSDIAWFLLQEGKDKQFLLTRVNDIIRQSNFESSSDHDLDEKEDSI
jgi:hypothetical protein